MKKIIYLLTIALGTATLAVAQPTPQLLPSVRFGIKAGANLSSFSTSDAFNSNNRAGYLAGIWARVGAGPWYFQPELYYNARRVNLYNRYLDQTNTAKFNSVDLPLLFGRKLSLIGVTPRINTGPVVSFTTNDEQTAVKGDNSNRFNFKDQNYAWQFGVGVDIQKISFDLRYELGLNKVKTDNETSDVRLNMFNLSVAYRLFSL